MNTLSPLRQKRLPEIAIHCIVWIFILGLPIFFLDRQNNADLWKTMLRFSELPFYLMAIFYLNYLWLIPHFLFKGKTRSFLLCNVLFVGLFCFTMREFPWHERNNTPPPYEQRERREQRTDGERREQRGRRSPHQGGRPPVWLFVFRDFITLSLAIGASATIRMSARWRSAEMARQEAEQSKAQAELKNLKNQLSPHFLLNTLNNIYALIVFDADKAQNAVLDLSKLLRYVLYENQTDYVPLYKEVDFIRNYIDLMRIRLTENVAVETRFSITPDSVTPIAPLLFISLIENAFKHGTSPEAPSFIRITLEENKQGIVTCRIENSNHPKSENDKSGSGIGLEQVRIRLEHLYPGRYQWDRGTSEDGSQYFSTLSIDTKNNL